MNKLRIGLLAALGGNIVLLGTVAGVWWHFHSRQPASGVASQAGDPPVSMGPATPPSPGASPGHARTPLAPLQIGPERLQSIGVTVGEVRRKLVQDEIRTTGNIAVDERRLAYVQVRFSGYIQKVFVDSTYQYVRKGQPLFTIYSPELVAAEREYLVARHNRQFLSHSTDRSVVADAHSLVDAAVQRLEQWQVPRREIKRLESTGRVQQDLTIDSPVSGFVTEREALPNKFAQPDTRLYTVADLSRIWAFAQVFQNDLGHLKVGDPATLTVDTYPGRTFKGRVDFIYPDIDMTTRAARVRLALPNPDLKLTPGMFVNIRLAIPMGRQLVVPASGVLQTGTRAIAFLDRGGGNLEPKQVRLGRRVGDDYTVLAGLKAGERIVTSANFLIDSESQLQAALGTFAPPPPQAAGAAGAPSLQLALSTQPSPPQVGGNRLRATLTTAAGVPVDGAQVTAAFLIPAMPAMGMSAMHAAATLSGIGKGIYEGSVTLPTGGTWRVTLVAQRKGQVIASRELSLSATGGQ